MNDGLRQAAGQFIAYLDDDNQWEPEYLSALARALEEDPNLVLVYSDTRDHYSVEALQGLRDDRPRTAQTKMSLVFPHMPVFPGYREIPSGNGYIDYIDTNEMMHTRAALTSIGGVWPLAHPAFEAINLVQGVTHRTHNDLAVAEALIERFGVGSTKYISRTLNNYVHRSHPRYNAADAEFRAHPGCVDCA